jgi:hypothetical protein
MRVPKRQKEMTSFIGITSYELVCKSSYGCEILAPQKVEYETATFSNRIPRTASLTMSGYRYA